MRRVGILLAGCGVYDGSEIQEAVLVALALARRGLGVEFLAPDTDQEDVVDHSTAEAVRGAERRSVLVEAARLARGAIRALASVPTEEIDAVVVPGGLGTVKNLCVRPPGRVGGGPLRPDVESFLSSLAARRAPIAVVGLAETLLARLEGRPLDPGAMSVPASEVVADEERRTLFTPGFLGTDDPLAVADGIERLVDRLALWLGGGQARSIASSCSSSSPR